VKIPVIRKLAQEHSLEVLQLQEQKILAGERLDIEVPGNDEGEQLTHILGAIWVIEQTQKGIALQEALRAYAEKVRNSIE